MSRKGVQPSPAGDQTRLAVEGGPPVRAAPMPPRQAIGPAERAMIAECLDYYAARDTDPGYQGPYEDRYVRAFCDFMGGGHADLVATGTLALFAALRALDLPPRSEVIVSPITDPGTFSAIILAGHVPRLADAMPGSYNTGAAEVRRRLSPQTRAVLLVHATGQPADAEGIVALARAEGLKVVEDCSQAHGARLGGRLVGTFGDIAAFSTMYRKASVTGPCGGVVYTRDQELARNALAHADRGKPRWRENFDDRDPRQFLFPALNLHAGEISAAIGIASLARLEDTLARRRAFAAEVHRRMAHACAICRPLPRSLEDSPFIMPIGVDPARARGWSAQRFGEAVRAEGIPLNPRYGYLARDWPWLAPYLADDFETANARLARDSSFCLYLNEHHGPAEAEDIVKAIAKVERAISAARA